MSRREIRTENIRVTIAGQPALVSVPVIPPDAVGVLREGLHRRRQAARTGFCACGAGRQLTEVAGAAPVDPETARPTIPAPFDHRADCAAHAEQLGPAIEAWAARRKRGGRRGAQAG